MRPKTVFVPWEMKVIELPVLDLPIYEDIDKVRRHILTKPLAPRKITWKETSDPAWIDLYMTRKKDNDKPDRGDPLLLRG